MKIAQSANRGSKRRRQSYRAGSPKRRRSQEFVPSTETKRRKCIDSHGKAPLHKQEKTERVRKAKLHTQAKTKTVPKAMIPKLSLRNLQDKVPMFHAYTQNGDPQTQLWSQMQYRPRNSQFMGHESGGPCHVSNYKAGPAPDALRLAPFRPYTNPMVAPALRHQEYNQRTNGFPTYADSVYQLGARNVNHFVDQGSTYIQNIMGAEIYRGQRSCFLHCSMPGCGDLGANGCVVSSCWKCCRRTGRKCLRHQ
ncbi:uncharacterized protein LOC122067303 [Macadamia integrifolia]|uniref:uncharacterized protein LOC122067303 n=1 Tax=Macadamia integrifolia TaxID=60698 RepID=UPI001C4FFB22|nr:uncharacterized protein LOC122067303 [Macadamia integrifolia]